MYTSLRSYSAGEEKREKVEICLSGLGSFHRLVQEKVRAQEGVGGREAGRAWAGGVRAVG